MRYCHEQAITFDLAISREKKETIAEKRRRQRSQRYFEVVCKSLWKESNESRESRIIILLSTVGGTWNLKLIKISTCYGHERQ